MEKTEQLKQEIKELNQIAIDLQNQLHDLTEGLPANLNQLMETAKQTHDAFSAMLSKKNELKQLKSYTS